MTTEAIAPHQATDEAEDQAPDLSFSAGLHRRRVAVPTVLQMQAAECGAAALAMVLAHYGRWVSLEELRDACGVSRDGANAKRIVEAARTYGLEAKGVSMDLDRLPAQQFPCIAYWEFAHFVVIEGTSRRGVHVNDPARGRALVPWAEADRCFTGLVLRMSPGAEFVRDGHRRGALHAMRSRVVGMGGALAYLVLAGLALAVPLLLGPLALQAFVQQYLLGGQRSWGAIALAVVGLGAVLSVWVTAWQGAVGRRITQRLAAQEAVGFFEHALSLPVSYFVARYPGEVASRLQFADLLARAVTQTLLPATLGLITALAVAVAIAVFAWQLALIAVLAAAGALLVLRAVRSTRADRAARVGTEQAALGATVTYALRSIETVKATGSEETTIRTVLGNSAALAAARADMQRGSAVLGALPGMVTGVAGGAIVGVGGVLVATGSMPVGSYVAVLALVPVVLRPVAQWSAALDSLQQSPVWLARLDDLLDQRPEDVGSTVPDPDGPLELHGVGFRYSPGAPLAVHDLSLRVEPGRRVALVGASGSGKSTAARLAVGLLAPTEGEATLGDIPVVECDPAGRASVVGYVEQDVVLFAGSIRDNITLFDDSIDQAAVIDAARAAAVDAEIEARPGGYDAPVADGGRNLSGGQRQRLEIARVLVRRPRIVVLDEATSALDPVREQEVMTALAEAGCGLLVVAHRLSTVRDCDEIVVLERGRVVERGTHDELLARDGAYAALVRAG